MFMFSEIPRIFDKIGKHRGYVGKIPFLAFFQSMFQCNSCTSWHERWPHCTLFLSVPHPLWLPLFFFLRFQHLTISFKPLSSTLACLSFIFPSRSLLPTTIRHVVLHVHIPNPVTPVSHCLGGFPCQLYPFPPWSYSTVLPNYTIGQSPCHTLNLVSFVFNF